MVWLGLRILLASCPIELRGRYDSSTYVLLRSRHDSCIILLFEEFLYMKRDCKDIQEGKECIKGEK